MSIDYRMIGQRIREERQAHSMTQAALAESVDLSVAYISCIERAKKRSSLGSLVRIANALDTTVDCLLCGNQVNDTATLTSKWSDLLIDCSSEEKIHLYNIALALKDSLRGKAAATRYRS